MNKKLSTIVVLAIVIVLAVILLRSNKPVEQSSDDNAAIQKDLEGLNEGDLNTEFQGIDKDLQSL